MHTRFLWLCLIGALCSILAGCGGGGSSNFSGSGSSGISGTAQITTQGGPIFAGQPAPTPRPLANAVITVQPQGGGTEITRTLSGADGAFKIALPPGTYRVVPLVSAADQQSGMTAQSQDVTVSVGAYTTITVQYTLNVP